MFQRLVKSQRSVAVDNNTNTSSKHTMKRIMKWNFSRSVLLLFLSTFVFSIHVYKSRRFSTKDETWTFMRSSKSILKVDQKCMDLPQIRPSGLFFLNERVKSAASPQGVNPSFQIGTLFNPREATNHMETDRAHFALLNRHFAQKNKKQPQQRRGMAFDVGANQGFFTYFLAASGLEVHAFEISSDNFLALQHGSHFNTKSIADRVHVYPLGLSDRIARLGMSGKDYVGFLKETPNGTILSITFDCFAYHLQQQQQQQQQQRDISSSSVIDFVKIDVEGFEISVLNGAKQSLFHPQMPRIGSLLIEVGPNRWDRAGTSFQDGVTAMKDTLAGAFQKSYLLIRFEGPHWKTCPPSLAEHRLGDKNNYQVIENVHVHQIQKHEWEPLLKEMLETNADCNFWFTNE